MSSLEQLDQKILTHLSGWKHGITVYWLTQHLRNTYPRIPSSLVTHRLKLMEQNGLVKDLRPGKGAHHRWVVLDNRSHQ